MYFITIFLYIIFSIPIHLSQSKLLSTHHRIWDTETKEFLSFKGINWFGFETNCNSFHGLWAHSYSHYRNILVENKFNAIRLPISLETSLELDSTFVNPHCIPEEESWNNTSIKDVIDFVFDDLYNHGIYILLDIHTENENH